MPSRPFDITRLALPIFFALISTALMVASIVRAPLSWDGSFYLFLMLDRQAAYVPFNRWIDWLLEAPTRLASRFTSDLKILTLIFSLSYCAVPMIGLAVSYLVSRKRPALFIWPALGIGLATLPGIFCFHSESTMTAPLFWPVLLATLIGVGFVEFLLVAMLAISMLAIHPNAVSLLALGIITAYVSARTSSFNRFRFFGALALGLLCLARLLLPLTRYEKSQLAFSTLGVSFQRGVEGWPLAFLALTFLAAILCLRQGRNRKPKSFAADFALVGAVTAAGLMLVPWAINPAAWSNDLDYRLWVVPMSAVVMVACALDAWRKADQASMWRHRQPALIAIGAVFLIILSLQSIIWNRLTNRLLDAIRDGGCISRASLTWTTGTVMKHWSTTAYAIVLQDRTPHSLVLEGHDCEEYAADKTVHVVTIVRKSGHGWFDLDHVGANPHHPSTR